MGRNRSRADDLMQEVLTCRCNMSREDTKINIKFCNKFVSIKWQIWKAVMSLIPAYYLIWHRTVALMHMIIPIQHKKNSISSKKMKTIIHLGCLTSGRFSWAASNNMLPYKIGWIILHRNSNATWNRLQNWLDSTPVTTYTNFRNPKS